MWAPGRVEEKVVLVNKRVCGLFELREKCVFVYVCVCVCGK